MNTQEVKDMLEKHNKFIENGEVGLFDLSYSDLSYSDLRHSDLHDSDLSYSDLHDSDLRHSDLRHSDLRGSNLSDSNLSGANWDFSCFPLWCGGSQFKCDMRLVRQLFAHITTLEVVDADDGMRAALAAILPEAKKSHRAGDLGLLEEVKG
jgi:hypothetical protein